MVPLLYRVATELLGWETVTYAHGKMQGLLNGACIVGSPWELVGYALKEARRRGWSIELTHGQKSQDPNYFMLMFSRGDIRKQDTDQEMGSGLDQEPVIAILRAIMSLYDSLEEKK